MREMESVSGVNQLVLCFSLGPGRKKKSPGLCGHPGSVAALKYAVVGLYLLVFLILVGVFILAGKACGNTGVGGSYYSCRGMFL